MIPVDKIWEWLRDQALSHVGPGDVVARGRLGKFLFAGFGAALSIGTLFPVTVLMVGALKEFVETIIIGNIWASFALAVLYLVVSGVIALMVSISHIIATHITLFRSGLLYGFFPWGLTQLAIGAGS